MRLKYLSLSPYNTLTPSFSTTTPILKTLATYTPKHNADISSLSYLADLLWADADPTGSDPISILLEADLYNDFILDGAYKKGVGQLRAKLCVPMDYIETHQLLNNRYILFVKDEFGLLH